MYPSWLSNLFVNNICPECRGEITLDDIIAIGARRPESFEAHLREALAMIMVSCRHCSQCIHFTTRFPKGSLIDAVDELTARIEASPSVGPALFGPQVTQRDDDVDGSGPVRPSVRRDQSSTPPTQAEIKAFLARLRRMSFRPGSKDFDKFAGD